MVRREHAHRAVVHRGAIRRQSGFTLIEILAVVVILGIASAIIVPQIGTRNDLEAGAAARAIVADLLYAQNRAIATQQMQYVSFDVINQQYGLYSSMSPKTLLTQPVTQSPYVMTFGGTGPTSLGNVVLTSANLGNNSPTLAFDDLGTPYYYSGGTTTLLSGLGAIVVTSGNYSITINVTQDTGDISTTP